LKTLGKMTPEERQVMGPAINGLRDRITDGDHRPQGGTARCRDRGAPRDRDRRRHPAGAPAPAETGRIHPITQVTDELTAIFADMGFSIAEGPDIETDYYNFTALNFPEGHPAREMHDTFFFKPDEAASASFCAPTPRRCRSAPWKRRSRRSASSFRARPTGRIPTPPTRRCSIRSRGWWSTGQANVANLKWVLTEFCKAFFEVEHLNMRFRPSFFPFTEPSMEVDIQCDRSKPGEVRFGEGSDWMEILGCGMVHPNVLRMSGLDPDEYQGFAWGIGIDRLAMLKYGMPDLRAFFDADVRWLPPQPSALRRFRPLDMPTLFGGLSTLSRRRK
jgi:phenylalanyl-tRNA synthetase alpha chain